MSKLTASELDALPVGSVIKEITRSGDDSDYRKEESGDWMVFESTSPNFKAFYALGVIEAVTASELEDNLGTTSLELVESADSAAA